MKDSKAVNVTKQEIDSLRNREYGIYTNRIKRIERDPFKTSTLGSSDFSCQFNCKRDREQICTCKRAKYKKNRYYLSSQVYRSQNKYLYSRGLADIGVGSVKVLAKKRVKRIYLPDTIDTGVGSSEVISTQSKNQNWGIGYYDQKKTSSKCVGGVMLYIDVTALDEKLSPLIQTKSESTSPEVIDRDQKNINSDSYTVESQNSKVENLVNVDKDIKQQDTIVIIKPYQVSPIDTNLNKNSETLDPQKNKKSIDTSPVDNEKKNLSSDSLVQHIYNLEIPSFEKASRASLDPMENKLEREYRKIFSTQPKPKQQADEKPIPDFKSASILRRRFEALRQGLGRKRDSKKDSIVIKTSSPSSIPSRKDVSIVSDPPSLEARSFSKTKLYSPKISIVETRNIVDSPINDKPNDKEGTITNLPSDIVETEYQGVKGMFKLWGKKFYLDEDESEKVALLNENPDEISKNTVKKENQVTSKEESEKIKKEGKIFSFFKKKPKNKDKPKNPYKSGKGVTAGRCEVGDGLMIKIGLGQEVNYPVENSMTVMKQDVEVYDNILREAWLKSFLTSQIDLKKSAHIRWNNKMYTTSSSTVFELMDCVYKNNGIVMRSKSDMDTEDSSLYYSYPKPKVNFMKQNIKAFMIPKTILDMQHPKLKPKITKSSHKGQNKNIEVTFSNKKWFIDKSKAFSQNIEIVLHSNNFERQSNEKSSEYITINIPEGYFSDSTSDNYSHNHSSDEEVYKIVEYETPNSSGCLKKQKKVRNMDTGDHKSATNDIKVTVSIKDSENVESKVLETIIKRPPIHRDVVVQGSNVYIPKRCDVIGVGIITQKDIRDIKKPILKIQDYLSDEDSEPALPPQKKCEFAESYLQDYYRNWTPFGIENSSCVSESQLKGSSENNSLNSLNQGDGSKSCPNIYDDYQASTIVSSCETSSCSQCRAIADECKKPDDNKITKYLNKFKKKPNDSPLNDGKRVLPKDSLEVFKRRKMYATSNKSNWHCEPENNNPCEPYSVPSVEDKCAQNTTDVATIKPCSKRSEPKKRYCQKRVLLPDCNTMNDILTEQLSNKCIEGILTFKKAVGCDICKSKEPKCPKHTKITPKPICVIPQPPCKESCVTSKKPACDKKFSPSCNVPVPPPCPAGPPTPCQKPCPPKPPPCQLVQPCMRKSPCNSPKPCPPTPPTCQSPTVQTCIHKSPCSSLQRCDPPMTPCAPPRCSFTDCHPRPIPPRHHVPQHSNKRTPCSSPPRQHSPPCDSPTCKIPPCQPFTPRFSPPRCPNPPPVRSPPKCPSPPPCPSPPKKPSPPKNPCPATKSPPMSPSKNPCPKKTSSTSLKKSSCSSSEDSCPSSPKLVCSSPPTNPCPPKKSSCTCLDKKSSSAGSDKSCQSSPKKTSCTNLLKKPCPAKKSSPTCPRPKKKKCSKPATKSPCMSPKRSDSTINVGVDDDCRIESKASGMSLSVDPKPCHPTGSFHRYADAVKRFVDKVQSSLSPKKLNECPNKPQPELPSCLPPPTINDNECPTKLTGLHLKKLPSHKTSDCSDKSNNDNLIRLNSKEEIHIKLRQGSPSTDEIREGCNIKVQDEDGRTLYERRDYTRNRPYIVRDLYRDSHVNRVSTPNINNDIVEEKKSSETKIKPNNSLCNVVEINLTLKFKQKDKTTEVNINNCGDNPTDVECTNNHTETPKEVYLVQDQKQQKHKEKDTKDLNIKVTIKNYKQTDTPILNENIPARLNNEEFSKKISNKFKTVSTGYSEMFLNQQAYSMHNTKLDSNKSKDKINSEQLFGPNSVHTMNLENTQTHDTAPLNDPSSEQETSKQSKSDISVKDITSVTTDKSFPIKTASYTKETINVNDNNSNDEITDNYEKNNQEDSDSKKESLKDKKFPVSILKVRNKEEKKEMLKNIFEFESNLKGRHKKEKMKQIRQMLRAILTSNSSDNTNISNQLADEVTYASLKPNYFRDTDSMNSYCHVDSSVSEKESKTTDSEDQVYPTEEDDNNTSGSSNSKVNDNAGCLCSHVAAKLNMNQNGDAGCCCGVKEKKNEETNCNLTDDFHCLDNTKYVNVETQDSKFGKPKSVIMANMSTTARIEEFSSDKEGSKSKHKCPHHKRYRKNNPDLTDLAISNKKILFPNSNEVIDWNKSSSNKDFKPEDILQLNETKKAVLEIYAEKTISARGQHIVARLPKFVANKESDVRNYEEIVAGFKHISRRNTTTLSIRR